MNNPGKGDLNSSGLAGSGKLPVAPANIAPSPTTNNSSVYTTKTIHTENLF